MTLWQDQSPRQPTSGTAGGPARGAVADPARPGSRREARERERQAADALSDGREHPSGVVDFDGYDFDQDFAADQGFPEADTSDIWASLARRSRAQPPAPTTPGTPQSEALPPVTDDLMDRIRGAVLRREREPEVPPTVVTPVTAARTAAPAARPGPGGLPSRRSMRRDQPGRVESDGTPSAFFSDRTAVPAAFSGAGMDDLPPTVAMSMPALDRADLDARAPMTAPVGVPRGFAPVAGDDALAFSSIAPMMEIPEQAPLADSHVDPSFLEPVPAPEQPWAQRHQAWSAAPVDDFESSQAFTEPPAQRTAPGVGHQWDDAHVTATPAWSDLPAQPAAAMPATSWADQQPYSEPTDLAGFEALIKKARGAAGPQAQAIPPAAPAPQRAWAEPDEPSPFERAVAAAHGSSNALVLPADPTPDLTQAVNSTGDIFITGSMKLPRSLSTTGATEAHYDGPDVDRLFEAAHNEPAAGVAPVRASRAIGGTPAGHPIVGRRQRSNVLPTVLAVVAGAMALGVLVLLVGSWVLRLF